MEELKQAAEDYFKTASEEYKQHALASGESLTEFYIRETRRSIRDCDVCGTRLLGFYFCCINCEFYKTSYSLCVKCFDKGKFKHKHDSFADNHSVQAMYNKGTRCPPCVIEKKREGKGIQLLQPPVQQTTELKKQKGDQDLHIVAERSYKRARVETNILEEQIMMSKEGMEKLVRIAKAYYDAAPQRFRNSAQKFFWSMVKAGRASVALDDFIASMKEKGYSQYAKPEFFQLLVKDGNQNLNFSGALTLYYIIVSERPFCSYCKRFIPDIFFCCSKCPASRYSLCLHCYESQAYVHHTHYGDDDVIFLDYTVLHSSINTSVTSMPRRPNLLTDENTRVSTLNTIEATLNACTAALTFTSAFCSIM